MLSLWPTAEKWIWTAVEYHKKLPDKTSQRSVKNISRREKSDCSPLRGLYCEEEIKLLGRSTRWESGCSLYDGLLPGTFSWQGSERS